jgi:phage repressor protein C with HTH and peptisase S24 domain
MIQLRRVVGDSMLPAYKNGQLVIASYFHKPKVGYVVVAVQNGREVLKRVVAIDSNHMVELIGDNKLHSTDSRHYGKVPIRKVLGVVVWPKVKP